MIYCQSLVRAKRASSLKEKESHLYFYNNLVIKNHGLSEIAQKNDWKWRGNEKNSHKSDKIIYNSAMARFAPL